jgi:hypothetical protein
MPSDTDFPPDQPFPVEPGEPRRQWKGGAVQERDVVRMLVQFGNRILEQEQISVAEYILSDIGESLDSFDDPLYAKIAIECRDMLLNGKTFDQHYFIQHPSAEVCELTINILSEPWDYSPNWINMWNYPLQNQKMPELNFDLDMKQALLRFKLLKVNKMCDQNLARIKAASVAGDDESMMRYMKVQQKLLATRNEIAAKGGTVIFPK